MRHLFKDHIKKLNRYQTSEGRDLESGLRLDRNERVSNLPEEVLKDIFSGFRPYALAAHPESDFLYDKISSHIGFSKEHIYITSGITDGIKFLFGSLCTSEHNVVVLDPTYPMYSVYAGLHDVEYRKFLYDEVNLKPDWDTLVKAMDEKTALTIIANPNMPVESAFTRDEITDIAHICKTKGSALIVDEAYHYFGAESAIGLIPQWDNLVVMRSFSKAFGLASARLGFMVSSVENIEYLSKTRSLVESNTLSMALAAYMLDHPEILDAHIREVKEGSDYLMGQLDRMGLRWHGGHVTNGMLIFLDGRGKPEDLLSFLKDRKIYIRGAFKPPFDRCVRVTIGSKEIMRKFIETFEEWLSTKAT